VGLAGSICPERTANSNDAFTFNAFLSIAAIEYCEKIPSGANIADADFEKACGVGELTVEREAYSNPNLIMNSTF
jgi:hypothetical protein